METIVTMIAVLLIMAVLQEIKRNLLEISRKDCFRAFRQTEQEF